MIETTHSQDGIPTQATPGEHQADQFRHLLATAITLRIKQMRATGRPSVRNALAVTGHFDRAQTAPLYPLAGQAGADSHTIRQTAEALAVLSFIPGGIYAQGMYCQASANPPVILYSDLLY